MTKGAIRCFIAIGSNLDNPEAQIKRALVALGKIRNSTLAAISPLYRNSAIGPGQQPDYLNAAAELYTTLDALTLLAELQRIELAQGRTRNARWAARTLDLDILLYGDALIDLPQLQIPHPRMNERNFVLYPLHDIADDLVLPHGTSLSALLDCCPGVGLMRH